MDKLTKAREIIGETDREIAALFEKRMEAVRLVAEHKKEHGLSVFDSSREDYLVKKIPHTLTTRKSAAIT